MKHACSAIAGLFTVALLGTPAFACLWDYDTLAMERQRFPSTLELITGKFLRHSEAFYEWRVRDRQSRLQSERSPNLYDDLAVAYSKLGDDGKAVATMLEKDELFPGKYETAANLGTFYIHAGQLQRGLKHIERAIAINPDAHFGREEYQMHLVRYVLSKQSEGGPKLPLNDTEQEPFDPTGFAGYLVEVQNVPDSREARVAEWDKALKGVLGMMRFGNHDSPILLEVLGDLLLSRSYPEDGKRLAARAYLKASYESSNQEAKQAYRRRAEECLDMQWGLDSTASKSESTSEPKSPLDTLEKTFTGELNEADRWFEGVSADERRWIQAGVNLAGINADEAFARKYYDNPTLASPSDRRIWAYILAGTSILANIAILIVAVKIARRAYARWRSTAA